MPCGLPRPAANIVMRRRYAALAEQGCWRSLKTTGAIVPRCMHFKICRRSIYAPRLSEEIENRTGNTAPGYRVDQGTVAGSGTNCKGDDGMNSRRYEKSSGSVFKDLGLPDAEEHLVKAKLVWKIDGILKERGLKQVELAALLGVRQPDVSKMLRGEFRQFSVERLLRFLVALGQDVEIVVKPHQGKREGATLHVS